MRKVVLLCCCLLFGVALCAAQTYSNIDQQTNSDDGTFGWGSCSSCAGGQNTTDQFSTSLQATPSIDGTSRQFFVLSTLPYTDALWWYKLGPNDTASRFTLDFWFYVDDNTTTSAQALEFDTFQFVNGRRFMFGTQCDYQSRRWDVWNEGSKTWVKTRFRCQPFTANTWHHVVATYHRNRNKVSYDRLSVDGVTARINVDASSGPLPAGWGDNLGVQFQLDIGANGGQATEWVDMVTLTAQ